MPYLTLAPKPERFPICPICGAECGTVYRDRDGDIFGCEECIDEANAWEAQECFSVEE